MKTKRKTVTEKTQKTRKHDFQMISFKVTPAIKKLMRARAQRFITGDSKSKLSAWLRAAGTEFKPTHRITIR